MPRIGRWGAIKICSPKHASKGRTGYLLAKERLLTPRRHRPRQQSDAHRRRERRRARERHRCSRGPRRWGYGPTRIVYRSSDLNRPTPRAGRSRERPMHATGRHRPAVAVPAWDACEDIRSRSGRLSRGSASSRSEYARNPGTRRAAAEKHLRSAYALAWRWYRI